MFSIKQPNAYDLNQLIPKICWKNNDEKVLLLIKIKIFNF